MEVGVLKTTPVEYVSTTLNTALKGAAFHLRAARGRELRGGGFGRKAAWTPFLEIFEEKHDGWRAFDRGAG
jgi:hypothetical protein